MFEQKDASARPTGEGAVEKRERRENHRVSIEIGEKFWQELLHALHGSGIKNPGFVDAIFRSTNENVAKAFHRVIIKKPLENGEWVLIGIYDPTSGSIHFNVAYDEVPLPIIRQSILHEMVHMVQDELGKFPEMGHRNRVDSNGVDTESPWEKEAYRLQEVLFPIFEKECPTQEGSLEIDNEKSWTF